MKKISKQKLINHIESTMPDEYPRGFAKYMANELIKKRKNKRK